MGFVGEIILKKIDYKSYEVCEELWYITKVGVRIIVPKGFLTDGASIPRLAWRIIGSPFTGKYTGGSLVHDWLYHTQTCTRSYADSIFKEAMEVSGVSWLKRNSMWLAVRTFGFIPWNYHKRRNDGN